MLFEEMEEIKNYLRNFVCEDLAEECINKTELEIFTIRDQFRTLGRDKYQSARNMEETLVNLPTICKLEGEAKAYAECHRILDAYLSASAERVRKALLRGVDQYFSEHSE